MKKKAEKNQEVMKLEKKNKKLTKGDFETVFNKNETKKDNINIFTAGLSYEKIDQNKYNKALTNFNHLFGKDLNKINNNKKGNEKLDKKFQVSKTFLYERALYNSIELEIDLENIDNKKAKNKNEIISLLNNFLMNENNFFYYEFSNTRNMSFNKLSEGDYLLFRPFIKEFDNPEKNSSNKENYFKQMDFINTMNNLYYKYTINKKLFFIITPLYSFSFDYNKEIPLLLTNSKTLEIELNKNDIKLIKINNKFEKNKNNISSNKEEKTIIETTNNNNDINKMEINEEETGETDYVLFGIKRLYIGQFYNYFINQNISKPFNIFSNYEFEGGIFRKCKYQIIDVNNITKSRGNILIKIEGVIFGENINKIVNFIKSELNVDFLNVRLNKIKSTSNFYLENKEIESNFDKFDFKKDNFYFCEQ